MASTIERLAQIVEQIRRAEAITQADPAASRVLVAVVKEFRNKSIKALQMANEADEAKTWEAIVELEQAGDSALRAVEADSNAERRTRDAVIDAHQVICDLKAEMQS